MVTLDIFQTTYMWIPTVANSVLRLLRSATSPEAHADTHKPKFEWPLFRLCQLVRRAKSWKKQGTFTKLTHKHTGLIYIYINNILESIPRAYPNATEDLIAQAAGMHKECAESLVETMTEITTTVASITQQL